MKKVFLMLSLLALSLGMQAQTKFHDVEANDATGAVKYQEFDDGTRFRHQFLEGR